MGTMRLVLPWQARISHEPRGRNFCQETGHGDTGLSSPEFSEGDSSPAADLSRSGQSGNAMAAAMPGAMDDAALASACQSGDLRALESLYHVHGSRMKSVARNLLGTTADAEDA